MGGVRRLARQSLSSGAGPVLADNWTTEETTTYDEDNPAENPGAWGGTVADLDRVFTATGATHTALGALLTFIEKPDQFAGVILKVQATFDLGSAAALELWTLDGAEWTKRRRVPIAGLARSGESVILDLATPSLGLDDDACDAFWITLAPDVGNETLTWTILHVYGNCDDDPVTANCPPGTPPEDCDGPECGVDYEAWICLPPPEEPDPVPPTFTAPPIVVPISFPPARPGCGVGQPPFNILRFQFGEIPTGGSVTVTVGNPQGILFAAGVSQTISAPGTMDWIVATGPIYQGVPVFPTSSSLPGTGITLPPQDTSEMTFLFTLQLDASVFETAGALLDILTYFWTFGYTFNYPC